MAGAGALAYAQASITGVARDTSGAVLPGVTVEATSPALIERVRSYNALNGNTVLVHSTAFATWLRPQSMLLARFLKFGFQLHF